MSHDWQQLQTKLELADMSAQGAALLVETDRRQDRWPIPADIHLTDSPPPERVPLQTAWLETLHRLLDGDLPTVHEAGPWLRWSLWIDSDPGSSRHERWLGFLGQRADGCLNAFMKLADAAPERVLAFAQRWGVLALCEHGAPAGHLETAMCRPLGTTMVESAGGRIPSGIEGLPYAWEPIAAWRRFAAEAEAILSIAADMRVGTPASKRDIAILKTRYGTDRLIAEDDLGTGSTSATGKLLERVVRQWLGWGSVRLDFNYEVWTKTWKAAMSVRPPDSTPGLAFGDLFGQLAIQLATALTSPRGIFRCDNPACLRPYTLDEGQRRPKSGPAKQKHFCPDCRAGDLVSKRLSAQNRRADQANRLSQ